MSSTLVPLFTLLLIWPLSAAHALIRGTEVADNERTARQVHRFEIVTQKKGTKAGRSTGLCGASLISPRIAISVAHCLPEGKERFSASLVVTDPLGEKKRLRVIDWEKHPSEDLALLKLESQAPAEAEILSLPNPESRERIRTIEATGYGSITGEVELPRELDILRKSSLEVTGYARSLPYFHAQNGLCIGDSGSPALIYDDQDKAIIFGVAKGALRTSNPSNDCPGDSIYAQTLFFLSWIQSGMSQLETRNQRPANLILGK